MFRDLFYDYAGPMILMVLFLTPIVLGCFFFAWYSASRQAEIFNRCTGAHLTTSDAFWGDVKIVDCPVQR